MATGSSARAEAIADAERQRNLALIYGRTQQELAFDPDKRSLLRSRPQFVDADAIRCFEGEYQFLAPDFPCPVCLQDDISQFLSFPSYEHALQASRVTDLQLRKTIQEVVDGAREVKRLVGGKQRENWKDSCLVIAEQLIRDKFTRNKELRKKLMDTNRKAIIYSNKFGDLFWGVNDVEKGLNHLGLLLERVREQIRSGELVDRWLNDMFSWAPVENVDVDVIVSKGNEILDDDGRRFEKKVKLYIGKDDTCEIVAEHPSVSRSNSVFVVDKKLGPCVVDLGSANGTFINNVKVTAFTPNRLPIDAYISVGASKRQYRFRVDLDAQEKRKVELYHKIANPLNSSHDDKLEDIERDYETTIFVRNIPAEASERDVRSLFESCGGIAKLSMPLDKRTNKHRGIAFVTFANLSALLQGVSRDGDEILGVPIKVKRNLPPPSGKSFDGAGRGNRAEVARGSREESVRGNRDDSKNLENDLGSHRSRRRDGRSRSRSRSRDRVGRTYAK
jgi:predicted NAD-dependent protein-ADP-ribosyltransferase YbiA (DUF1768 family)/pSer/pThr/pTyr-binding forkhead associated (FHA) protein